MGALRGRRAGRGSQNGRFALCQSIHSVAALGVSEPQILESMSERLLNGTTTTGGPSKHAVSSKRWFCLLCATGIAGLQGGIWNNFGPISEAVEPFYGWNDATIALQSNWGPIAYFIAVIPTVWLLDVVGLRTSMLVGSGLVLAGSVLRVLHVAPDGLSGVLMHGGQFLNGLAGPIGMSIGPVVSAAWFAPHERTMATAVQSASNYGFCALTFVLGPMLVPPVDDDDKGPTQRGLRNYMLGEPTFLSAPPS